MKNVIYVAAICCIFFLHSCAVKSGKSSQQEWKTLFNGKDINDWVVKIHHHETGENFGNTFRVVDSVIQIRYDQYDDFNNQFGADGTGS